MTHQNRRYKEKDKKVGAFKILFSTASYKLRRGWYQRFSFLLLSQFCKVCQMKGKIKKHSNKEAKRQTITTMGTGFKNFPIIPPIYSKEPGNHCSQDSGGDGFYCLNRCLSCSLSWANPPFLTFDNTAQQQL